jgi:hypothetical protein
MTSLFRRSGSMLALLVAALILGVFATPAEAGFFRKRSCRSCGPVRSLFVRPAPVRGYFAPAPQVTCSDGQCVPKSFPAFVPADLPAQMCPGGKCPPKK